ncbi:hypothetical protein [Rhodovibrio sodomensis]|uniref:hypothetical protein n=1 Tax=Rhodovibrio sodomensis TaxID=1088 RepID=UPI00190628BA
MATPTQGDQTDENEKQDEARFRWVLGVPYFVQGTSHLTEVPILYFIKFSLGMGEAGGQLFDSLRNVGWFIKPVWGLISDRVPLFGYRRKSWFVLMAFLAMAFWAVSALLSALGVRTPAIFLVSFNLAFATYAFVDVVCDALMVERGRRSGKVGTFVNFQWGALAVANAGSVMLGSYFQTLIQDGQLQPWVVFAATGVPPLATAYVGLRNIKEDRQQAEAGPPVTHRLANAGHALVGGVARVGRRLPGFVGAFRRFRQQNRLIWYLVLFLFFWKFNPSVGFIERSYLIDERGFSATSFGLVLSLGGLSFLASVLAYAWITRRFPKVRWEHYLYAMVFLGVLSFPLSFFLYLEPGHPWWEAIYFTVPDALNPLPTWNRYEWFRLLVQTLLGFATIPAFLVPLTIAGETVSLTYAGVSYAFLMSLTNVTNMFEGVVGAGLYDLLTRPWMTWLVSGFQHSLFDIAGTGDTRTAILEIFVYISLVFSLLTIPFILLLKRELTRRGIEIHLAGRTEV